MPASGTPTYVLGHSEDELGRLGRQAKLIDPITRHYFERAGVGPGMRVLDIGSGAGHVAHLVADLNVMVGLPVIHYAVATTPATRSS